MKHNTLFGVVVTLILSACTSVGRLEKGASLNTADESIIVLGVAPSNYRISLFPGERKDGVFHQNIFRPAVVYSAAEDGFIITKAKAGDTLAITNIRLVENKESIYGPDFGPCDGKKTMVFDVPAGKVLYLGSIEYEHAGKNLLIKYGHDVDAARTYFDKHYPLMLGRIEPWLFDLLPTTLKCTSTITVPIYLPRK